MQANYFSHLGIDVFLNLWLFNVHESYLVELDDLAADFGIDACFAIIDDRLFKDTLLGLSLVF